MEIKNRIWDDYKNEILEPGSFTIIDNGFETKTTIISDDINNQYDGRYIVESYTNRKDKNGTEIFAGDIIAPIDDENNPGDFILFQSEVRWFDGCWILEDGQGKFRTLYEMDSKDLQITGHMNYKNHSYHFNKNVIQRYIFLKNDSIINVDTVNEIAKLYNEMNNGLQFHYYTDSLKLGAATSWFYGLPLTQQRAYKFDFGMLRTDDLQTSELVALYKHYIIDLNPLDTYNP